MSNGIVMSVCIILLCLFGIHKFNLCRLSLICVAIIVLLLGTSSFFSAIKARRAVASISNLLNVQPIDEDNKDNKDDKDDKYALS